MQPSIFVYDSYIKSAGTCDKEVNPYSITPSQLDQEHLGYQQILCSSSLSALFHNLLVPS